MAYSNLSEKPKDPIIKLFGDFMANPNPNKVNLSIGIYFDENGRIDMFNSVRKANIILAERNAAKGYLPIEGNQEFCGDICKLVFGDDHPLIKEGRIASVQTIAATGGLRLTGEFLNQLIGCKRIFVTNPTWSNHIDIYQAAGMEVLDFPHYDYEAYDVDFEGMMKTLEAQLEEKDCLLLHPVCHNPTGADLKPEQWRALCKLIAERKALAVFDMAYLGYGDGLVEDRTPLLIAAEELDQFLHIFSGSKSFGLYSERIGSVNVICKDADQAKIVQSNLKTIIRCSYSTPTSHGSHLIHLLLTDPELRKEWESDLEHARSRLVNNRKLLVEKLKARGIDWSYILDQKGFFSFLKITPEQARELRSKYAIYLLDTGRVNFAGLNPSNIDYVVDGLVDILGA